eukprot:1159549-Pelagomonas_calceolata.AAC.1
MAHQGLCAAVFACKTRRIRWGQTLGSFSERLMAFVSKGSFFHRVHSAPFRASPRTKAQCIRHFAFYHHPSINKPKKRLMAFSFTPRVYPLSFPLVHPPSYPVVHVSLSASLSATSPLSLSASVHPSLEASLFASSHLFLGGSPSASMERKGKERKGNIAVPTY